MATSASLLKDAGMRATPQRIAVLDVLRKRARPVSADELVALGKGVFDLTTAYRTLESLTSEGITRKMHIGQGSALFELADDHHHHAVCVSCGRIRDVSACVSPSLDASVRKAAGFSRIDSHSLEFFGVCTSCA